MINEPLLKEIRETKTKPDFSAFFRETKNAFKNEDLLEVDRKRKHKFTDSTASVYSLVLRLKTMRIMQSFKQKENFSNKKFSEFLQKHGFGNKAINEFLEVYRAQRDSKKTPVKISLNEANRLFDAAKKELEKTKKMVFA